MAKKVIYTRIRQGEVEIVTSLDFPNHEKNKPSNDWELIKFKDGSKAWVPKYTLGNELVSDARRWVLKESQ